MNINEIFQQLGFNEYETKIYITLNKLKSATATEISQNSTVPRNKVYEVIENMKEKGFIMELPIKPKKFKITNLEKLRDIIAKKEEKLKKLNNETDNLFDFLKEESLSSNSKEQMWVIKGQKNIVEKIAYEMTNMKEETLSVFRSNASIGTSFRNTKNAIERGVKIKMIGQVNKKSLPKIQKYLDMGVEFRVYDEKKLGKHGTRFSVFDKKKCRITIGKPEVESSKDYITLWCESPSFASLMRMQFFTMWEQCEPIEEYLKKNKKINP